MPINPKGTVRIVRSEDVKDIHNLFISNRWEYLLDPIITEEGLKIRDKKYFSSNENKTLVYRDEQGKLVGVIRFFEIEDNDTSSPDFTIYVDEQARGKGIGKELIQKGI